jgi:hypothetical protein
MQHVRPPPQQRQFWTQLSLQNELQLRRAQQKRNERRRRHEMPPLRQPWQQI